MSIRSIRAVLALALVLALAGCEDPAQPAVRLLRIQPDSSTIPGLGIGVTLQVVYVDEEGNTVGAPAAGEVSWSSLEPAVATAAAAGNQGQATAQGPGRARIVATAGTRADTAVVGVVQVPAVIGVGVLGGPQLVAGGSLRAVAEVNDAGGIRIAAPALTWSTSNPAVLAVDATGRITGTGAGTADLRVQSGTVTASVNVRVLEPLVASTFSAGGFTTCAVDAQGRLSCWAGGHLGQLGTGVQDVSLRALPVAPALRFTQVSAGGIPAPSGEAWPRSHVCAVATTGSALCWGMGAYGQLGTGSLPPGCTINGMSWPCSLQPAAVAGNISWSTVVAGPTHTCGISTAGVTYCWGANNLGQLGAPAPEVCPAFSTLDTAIPCATAPVPLAAGAPVFTSLALGQGYTCGLTAAGAAWCWGGNGSGQLGDGTTTPRPAPVQVAGGHTFTEISAELHHTCGLSADGGIYCWGRNLDGELGVAGGTTSSIPVRVSGGGTYVQVSAGPHQTCGVRTGGAAFCWGRNGRGALGVSQPPTASSTPVAVQGGHLFSSVSAGVEHTCGRRAADGILMCWGYGFWLGAGEGANEGIEGMPVPVQAPAP